MMERPFSQACENNKLPILEVLRRHFTDASNVLEVGSGTGQHAVFFAERFPHLRWQPADRPEYLSGIRAWLDWAQLDNLPVPLPLDVNQSWPVTSAENIFSANTLHIMSWPEVEKFFSGVDKVLQPGGILCVYGPFNYGGQYTSDSNARFDQWLAMQNPQSAIRDFEAVNSLAEKVGLILLEDNAMPANNRCLVWQRKSSDN